MFVNIFMHSSHQHISSGDAPNEAILMTQTIAFLVVFIIVFAMYMGDQSTPEPDADKVIGYIFIAFFFGMLGALFFPAVFVAVPVWGIMKLNEYFRERKVDRKNL